LMVSQNKGRRRGGSRRFQFSTTRHTSILFTSNWELCRSVAV
jgi:hypothetical protein